MNTLISQLPAREQSDLQRLTQKLVSSMQPQFIFCYGSRKMTVHRMSCFARPQFNEARQYSYDIAIVLRDQETRPNRELFAIVKKSSSHCFEVNTILHRCDFVFEKLENGNFFFSWLLRAGICLYGNNKLPEGGILTRKPGKMNLLYPETQSQVRQWLLQGGLSWQQAKDSQESNQPTLSLFHSSESIVYSLWALLLGSIGYHATTPSLSVLLGYASNITSVPASIFPRNTPEEARLFRQVAGKQLEEDAPITVEEITILTNRAEKMNRVVSILLVKSNSILKMP